MTDNQQLLADYAGNGSEEAFRELVARYLSLVYSTAVRLVGGDVHLAEDVSQTVFLTLARKARTLPDDVMLGGWLHRTTCFVAANTLRGERRRRSRERQSVEMNALSDHAESALNQIAPLLDDAINQLEADDRAAVLLRYFEQRDLRAIGQALGSSEDAARMRVNRALDKLQILLKRRGVALSAAALGTVLAADAVSAAPAGLALTISSAALAGATTGTGSTLAFLKFMTATQIKFGLGVLVIVGVTTALMVQHQAQLKLDAENESLRQKIARLQTDNEDLAQREAKLRLRWAEPVPDASAAAAPTSTNGTLYARYKENWPKLNARQVEDYLKANGRKASTLLAGYRTSRDPALLKEAMEEYPKDPQVAFEAAISTDLTPDEKRKWVTTFEQNAPNNAMANYLSAFQDFSSGQSAQALQELSAASGKPVQDYTLDRTQDDKEAYLSAGYSVAESEAISSESLMLAQLAPVKEVGNDLVALANTYTQAGNPASAQAALQSAMSVGQSMADDPSSPTLIGPLVGLAVEKIALTAMDPNSPYGNNGQTVQDAINQIDQSRDSIRDLSQQAQLLMPNLTDEDWINYTDRRMVFGEVAALQWLVNKYGRQ